MAREKKDYENASFANAGLDELEKYEQWLLAQQEREVQEERKTAVFKTVDTFAGIMQRKMWLKNSQTAYTDGFEIGVPFESKNVYEYAEHEIAHNLFLSNFSAKEMFCSEYVNQIAAALRQSGQMLDNGPRIALANMIGMLLNVLEDHRVNSLWAMLYPGSYKRLAESALETLHKHRAHAHTELVTYFLLTAYDVQKVPPGRFDRFKPAMVSALKKVERKGPSAAFVVGKWLMTQLVSEIIRQLQNLPPPPDAGKARIQTDLDSPGDDTNDSADSGDSGTDDGNASGAAVSASGDSQAAGKKQDGWTAPDVNATKQDRVDALQKLIDIAASPEVKALASAKERLLDVKDKRWKTADDTKEAKQLVKQAMDTNTADNDSLEKHLQQSAAAMEATIETIKEALEVVRQTSEDDWITRDVHAKVRLVDVTEAPPNAVVMSANDRVAARRLKDLFQRVKSRTSKQLSDTGHEIDLESYINNKVGNTLGPVFKQETSGRGFKTLILVDRSSSMSGSRTDAAERATRILRQSLKSPNVEFHVWGFQSSGAGVQLTRIGSNVDLQNTGKMAVSGTTPLHIACKTAVNWLGSGHEKKQLIILTDGMPCYQSSSGKSYGESQLMQMVSKEVSRARKQGINVTTLVIGNEISDANARQMFGERRNWTRTESDGLDKELVKVATSSFVQYLSQG